MPPIRALINGNIPVAAVFASQVDYIQLKHTNTKVEQAYFTVSPKNHTFKLRLPSSQQ
jgi:hypothetical protein